MGGLWARCSWAACTLTDQDTLASFSCLPLPFVELEAILWCAGWASANRTRPV